MNKVLFNVEGLINTHTKTQIKNELEELNGIHQVEVDLVRSLISVEYNPPVTKDEIRSSIEHVGCRVIG
jgi:copper chaperone CopZ